MDKLEKKIGYAFRDRSLLQTALTHSSYSNERHGDGECYERLEFLGDSILGVVTAEFLYRRAPALPEGRMTRLRAELVFLMSYIALGGFMDGKAGLELAQRKYRYYKKIRQLDQELS